MNHILTLALALLALPIAADGKAKIRKDISITACGALSDGRTLCTTAIQTAIDSAAQSGARVVVPAGTYLTGPVVLRSHTTLQLDSGAVLLGSRHVSDYRDAAGRTAAALFSADNITDLAITGAGRLDGNGLALALDMDSLHYIHQWPGWEEGNRRASEDSRLWLINIHGCRRVRLSGVTFAHSNFWTVHIQNTDSVEMEHVRIDADHYWNNDGCDFTDCRYVAIRDCDINASDDGICLKSLDRHRANDHFLIERCRIRSSASGVKFGTNSNGGFHDIQIRDLEVYDTFRSALAFECVDGGWIDGVTAERITVRNTSCALFIRLGKRNTDSHTATIRNITVRNLRAQIAYGPQPDAAYTLKGPQRGGWHNTIPASITGLPGHCVENITLEDVSISYPGRGTPARAYIPEAEKSRVPELPADYPEYDMFGELPAYGLYARHVRGLKLRRVSLTAEREDYRPAQVFDDVE